MTDVIFLISLTIALIAIAVMLSDTFLRYKKAQLGGVASDLTRKEKKLLMETLRKLHAESQVLLQKNQEIEKKLLVLQTKMLLLRRKGFKDKKTPASDANQGLHL